MSKKYPCARPKGFAPWSPGSKAVNLLAQVNAVLAEFKDDLPVTIRQIYYRLVAAYGLEKSKSNWNGLGDVLVRARRARLIPFEVIADTVAENKPVVWANVPELIDAIKNEAVNYVKDKRPALKNEIIILTEHDGLLDQVVKAARPYCVAVQCSSGFDSVTIKKRIADLADREGPIIFLHIGDLDASGESIFDGLEEDVQAFMQDPGKAVFERLAVTREQVERFKLPEKEANPEDNRGGFKGGTVQVEAFIPAELKRIIKCRLVREVKKIKWRELEVMEKAERADLAELMKLLP